MKCMKLLLIVVILQVCLIKAVKAPIVHCLYIIEEEPLYAYNIQDAMLRAFVRFESNFKEDAVNPVSGARGILQILPPMIKEVNRIVRKKDKDAIKYTWSDAWDAQKSIEIWYIVQNYHNPEYNIQKACRIWFGIGIQYDGLTWTGYHKGILKYLI